MVVNTPRRAQIRRDLMEHSHVHCSLLHSVSCWRVGRLTLQSSGLRCAIGKRSTGTEEPIARLLEQRLHARTLHARPIPVRLAKRLGQIMVMQMHRLKPLICLLTGERHASHSQGLLQTAAHSRRCLQERPAHVERAVRSAARRLAHLAGTQRMTATWCRARSSPLPQPATTRLRSGASTPTRRAGCPRK